MSRLVFSVVIPTRNRGADLRRCLQAIADQDFPGDRFEVIVCDDGSETDVAPIVAEARRTGLEIRLLRQGPRGPAAARNLGIRNARGPIVALTDSDARPERRWLRKLLQAFEAHPDAVAVEGRVYADNEGEFDPLGDGPSNQTGGVFLTCNCAYRRNALLRAGGFDESFPYPAYEDVELAARVRGFGRIAWQPEAIVVHPQRRLTLRAVFKRLRHWEYVLLMGYRYGYLAWERYPVRYPRWRVAALSVIALPLSKFRAAAKWIVRRPAASLLLALYGLAEATGALLIVAPMALFGRHRRRSPRQNYL
ncbi:MAG TPA: glycosyltransferase [Blastocatellia bacterium]|nr:glycosyltransferase [Blastocatellia bacterium]